MTNFELPRNLVEDFQDEAPDSARRAWLAGLEEVVAEATRRGVGDPAYDPVQCMLNNPGRLISDSDGFIERIADLAGVDRERLAQWVFARCVSESIRSRPLREVAETMAAVI